MNDFLIFYAPLIVVVLSIALAFYTALRTTHLNEE